MRKDGRETRRNVIEKSLQIFSVKGYYNTSISDIMAATGLTKGGLYSHFDSKEALWDAAYMRAVELWRGTVFKGVRKVSDPLDRAGQDREDDRERPARLLLRGGVRGGLLLLQQPRRALGPISRDERPDRRRIHAVREASGLLAGRGEGRWQTQARRADQGGRRLHRPLHQRRGRVVRRDPGQPVPPGMRASAPFLHKVAESIEKETAGRRRRIA
ncbi:MAG: hypothetical protein H6Q82_3099 [Deltaproteobacteria bacterium]|nr:hypothetical protein [Deltaproteobacteria bacterium]